MEIWDCGRALHHWLSSRNCKWNHRCCQRPRDAGPDGPDQRVQRCRGPTLRGRLTGQNLGGQTLTAGVYCFASSAQLNGKLILNAQGNANAVFIFEIGGTLTTLSSSQVTIINGGTGNNVFWQVGGSATLGTSSQFAGNILALSNITLDCGADISCGRAWRSTEP